MGHLPLLQYPPPPHTKKIQLIYTINASHAMQPGIQCSPVGICKKVLQSLKLNYLKTNESGHSPFQLQALVM